MVFDLGRLAAALLSGGRGGRSAEARVVRAVTRVVTGEAPRSRGAEAIRRKKEAAAWGLPPPRPRSRRTSTERAIAAGAAVLAETIAERMTRGSVPSTVPPTPAPRAPAKPAPAVPPLAGGACCVNARTHGAKLRAGGAAPPAAQGAHGPPELSSSWTSPRRM